MFAAVAAQESQTSLLSTVMQQEMAQRRQRAGISRQDSRLSVKSLIESIEKSSHVSKQFFWFFIQLCSAVAQNEMVFFL